MSNLQLVAGIALTVTLFVGPILLVAQCDWSPVWMLAGFVAAAALFAWLVVTLPESPPCAVGHYETKHGFISTGKNFIPTTYQAYVCDVYESKVDGIDDAQ